MPKRGFVGIVAVLLALTMPFAGATIQSRWLPIFSTPPTALDGTVHALVKWDDGSGPQLIAGGEFVTAGWRVANRVARWDGVAWSPLGSGFDGPVRSLAVYNGELIATGDFRQAGDQTRNLERIARWNGSQWEPLGTGLNGRGLALLVTGGQLYVGGQFTNAGGQLVNRIAVWNGTTWSPIGAGLQTDVRALIQLDNEVHVGTTQGVFRRAGNAWQAVGSLGAVSALAVFKGQLVAGGTFLQGVGLLRVARWDGSSWLPLASGMQSGSDVRVLVNDGSTLVAGGAFTVAGSTDVLNLARWNGVAWSGLSSGAVSGVSSGSFGAAIVNAIVADDGTLFVGGDFALAGGLGAASIARWSPSEAWTSFATGVNDEVFQAEVFSGQLVVGGRFSSAAASPLSRRLGAWDGSGWGSFGGGFPEDNVFASLMTQFANELVVAGVFLRAGTTSANGIARWTGADWVTLGAGAQGISNLAATPTALFANGSFSSIGGQNAPGWAVWDGNDWSALNPPAASGALGCLKAYVGVLYACVGNTVWQRLPNGSWLNLGGNFGAQVQDAQIHQGDLYAGGSFSGGVAHWDGLNWVVVGALQDFLVLAMTSWNGRLVVAGLQVGPSGSTRELRVLQLIDGAWQPVGEAFDQPRFPSPALFINELEPWNERLVAVGSFAGTGGRRAVNLAAFGPAIDTNTTIVSAAPLDPEPGQPVLVTVQVTSSDGSPIGGVSVTGSPRGACSTVDLTAGANNVVATCSITFNRVGTIRLTAAYSGGTQGPQTWAASGSSADLIFGVGDRLFRDGFEQ